MQNVGEIRILPKTVKEPARVRVKHPVCPTVETALPTDELRIM